MLTEASTEDTLPPASRPPAARVSAPFGVGERFGERFVLGEALGQGSRAGVYSATDAHSQQCLALKIYLENHPAAREEQRRELAMLQRCQVDGVVRLVAHDLNGAQPWLAMERLDGELFPTPAQPRSWSALEGIFIALFESVARLHALGVAHRDIKPQNLRRRPVDGHPVLIDLGIAAPLGAVADPNLAPGTPRYMAPELHADPRPVDDKSDVFSLGVVLHEALTGAHPFQDAEHDADPPAAEIPRYLADLLRRMLARRPEARPNMAHAATLLRGAPLPDSEPWLGARTLLASFKMQPHRVIALGGPPGSGRSRTLRELAATLGEVRWLLPGERPFAALTRLLGDPGERPRERLSDWFVERLSKLQAPILADDWRQVDRESAALLEHSPPPGGLLRVVDGPGDLQPPLLSVADLIPLFAGPDRVLHLREDAAKELLRRTGGHAGQVVSLLRHWQSQGIVEQREGLRHISRANLDSLAVELQGGPPSSGSSAPLNEAEEELLAATRFAGAHASPENLACILNLSVWEAQAMIERLTSLGVLALDGPRVVARAETRSRWSEARRAQASRQLAERLKHGSPGRAELMLKGGLKEGLVEQALAEAEQHEHSDQPNFAIPLLEEVLLAAPGDEGVLAHLIHAKLQQRSDEDTESARMLASRSGQSAVYALVQAVAWARHGDAMRGYAGLRELSFGNAKLEMLRLASLVDAVRRGDPTQQESLLNELGELPIIRDNSEHLARWRTWYGGLRYQQRRFAEAGDYHAGAANRERRVGQLSSLTNAARSYLEACDFTRTRDHANRALELARDARLCLYEAEAEWALRAVVNREGGTDIDPELIQCAELLRNAALLPRVYLTEAFIAWRGARPQAVDLARKAERTLRVAGLRTPAAHAAALAVACGGEGDRDAIAAALWQGRDRFAEVVLDGLALLGAPLPGTTAERRALASRIPEDTWHIPRGALSIHEALRRLAPRA